MNGVVCKVFFALVFFTSFAVCSDVSCLVTKSKQKVLLVGKHSTGIWIRLVALTRLLVIFNLKCQVDCMSTVRYWYAANQKIDGPIFSSCDQRYIGYGCREMTGCRDINAGTSVDYDLMYSVLVSCAKQGGCRSKYAQFNVNGDRWNTAYFLAGVTTPIQGQNTPATPARKCNACGQGWVHWWEKGSNQPSDPCACVPKYDCWACGDGWVHWWDKGLQEPGDKCACVPKYDCWACGNGWTHWFNKGMREPNDKCACVRQ
ncbi:hypothetical protein AKO1_013372 [Acrasis kona]|uniref:Secreted protein n=1 Tax=Acrasis kona TaxID=1008807 RepID=A0AAW2YZY0_9EUKA